MIARRVPDEAGTRKSISNHKNKQETNSDIVGSSRSNSNTGMVYSTRERSKSRKSSSSRTLGVHQEAIVKTGHYHRSNNGTNSNKLDGHSSSFHKRNRSNRKLLNSSEHTGTTQQRGSSNSRRERLERHDSQKERDKGDKKKLDGHTGSYHNRRRSSSPANGDSSQLASMSEHSSSSRHADISGHSHHKRYHHQQQQQHHHHQHHHRRRSGGPPASASGKQKEYQQEQHSKKEKNHPTNLDKKIKKDAEKEPIIRSKYEDTRSCNTWTGQELELEIPKSRRGGALGGNNNHDNQETPRCKKVVPDSDLTDCYIHESDDDSKDCNTDNDDDTINKRRNDTNKDYFKFYDVGSIATTDAILNEREQNDKLNKDSNNITISRTEESVVADTSYSYVNKGKQKEDISSSMSKVNKDSSTDKGPSNVTDTSYSFVNNGMIEKEGVRPSLKKKDYDSSYSFVNNNKKSIDKRSDNTLSNSVVKKKNSRNISSNDSSSNHTEDRRSFLQSSSSYSYVYDGSKKENTRRNSVATTGTATTFGIANTTGAATAVTSRRHSSDATPSNYPINSTNNAVAKRRSSTTDAPVPGASVVVPKGRRNSSCDGAQHEELMPPSEAAASISTSNRPLIPPKRGSLESKLTKFSNHGRNNSHNPVSKGQADDDDKTHEPSVMSYPSID